jgi:hypothetical protein
MMGETPPDTREVIPTALKKERAKASTKTTTSDPAGAPQKKKDNLDSLL